MGLRPNRCYRKVKRSNTRQAPRVQRKDFLGGVPGVRTRQFVVGDQTKNYGWVVDLKAKGPSQIRDNALEALRQKIVRELSNKVGKDNWVLRIRLYPYHVLRENKAATGAGADRVSKGMKHSFGKNIGRAAQVKNNDIILSVVVDKPYIDIVKKILVRSKYKIFLPTEITVSEHLNKRLSGRKRWTREAKVALTEEKAPDKKDEKTTAKNSKTPVAAPSKGKEEKKESKPTKGKK